MENTKLSGFYSVRAVFFMIVSIICLFSIIPRAEIVLRDINDGLVFFLPADLEVETIFIFVNMCFFSFFAFLSRSCRLAETLLEKIENLNYMIDLVETDKGMVVESRGEVEYKQKIFVISANCNQDEVLRHIKISYSEIYSLVIESWGWKIMQFHKKNNRRGLWK